MAHLQKHGHGAAAQLGREIGRPSVWIGRFATGRYSATIDEAVALVRVLRARPQILLDPAQADPVAPVDEAQASEEARWLRLFRRLEDAERRALAFDIVESLARKRGNRGAASIAHSRKR